MNARVDSLGVFTVLVLESANDNRYLLLQRAGTKRFAPRLWTGIGGTVEPQETTTLQAAALRELREETGIRADEISNLVLRRVLLHTRDNLTLLLYFTGIYLDSALPNCTEGTLAWISPEQLFDLELIDNARVVVPLLIEDQQRDPLGTEPVRLGIAHYDSNKALERIVWV